MQVLEVCGFVGEQATAMTEKLPQDFWRLKVWSALGVCGGQQTWSDLGSDGLSIWSIRAQVILVSGFASVPFSHGFSLARPFFKRDYCYHDANPFAKPCST